jgi:D-beta-D-heptose 7-phosphate kinase / D-beta-D-heptose 1-phosphate adenosyltransferase
MINQLHEVIHEIEHSWGGKRLLAVGDVMLDRYIWGEVGRISPEAPVPVVRVTYESIRPGGVANVAMNLARLGAHTRVVGFAGGDENAKLLDENLRSNEVASDFIVSEGFPTIVKTRILGGQQQMLRLDREQAGARPPADYDRLVQCALARLPDCHALVLSDYAKGTFPPEVCQALIQAARRLDIPVLVDPKSPDFSRYRGATTICPNLAEIAAATRERNWTRSHGIEEPLNAAESMVRELDLEFLTATLSERGIALVRPGNVFRAPAVARKVFDVSGAGDTVIAVLALCLASGLSPETAVQLANIAAGIVVGKVGTAPVEKHELLAALAPEIALRPENKVLDRSEVANRVALWRANGERVVFTNGCFDLLHIGHIALLEQARRFGDRLIVAVNSDASVRALKGPSRPIVGEQERVGVLAALAAIDAVVVFSEPTPLELIVDVKPDVIVKGGDYNPNTVVGAKEAESWGGQVRIVPLVEGHSTTRLIERGAGEQPAKLQESLVSGSMRF